MDNETINKIIEMVTKAKENRQLEKELIDEIIEDDGDEWGA